MGMCEAAAYIKNTYLSAQYRRLAACCGKKKAMVAVGHSVLVIIYHVLSGKKSYEVFGGNYFDERERQATEKQFVRRLEKPGYQVSLQPLSLQSASVRNDLGLSILIRSPIASTWPGS